MAAPASVAVGVRVGVPHHEATVQDVLEVRRIVLRGDETCLISEGYKIRVNVDAARGPRGDARGDDPAKGRVTKDGCKLANCEGLESKALPLSAPVNVQPAK